MFFVNRMYAAFAEKMRVTLLSCTFSVVHNTYNFSSCKTRLKHFHSIFSGCFKSLPEKGRACTEIRTTASTLRLPAKHGNLRSAESDPARGRAARAVLWFNEKGVYHVHVVYCQIRCRCMTDFVSQAVLYLPFLFLGNPPAAFSF